VDFIFYPSLFYERNEFPDAGNHYNCPIVTSYSENIRNNVDEITSGKVKFRNPFMAFDDRGYGDGFPDQGISGDLR
jgi:predicted nucleotide-binding protein (sugar kinase/HSP70/actin superfamily)